MPKKPKRVQRSLEDRIQAAEDYLQRTCARSEKIIDRVAVLRARVDILKAKKQETIPAI